MKILVVDREAGRVAYDLYEVRTDQQLAHGVIDAAGEDPAGVVERLRARLAEHGIVAQHVIPGPPTGEIPVGISVRHVHLDRASCDALFGPGYELERSRDVSQPGQFAARETVDVIGPHGELHGVAIIAPLRAEAQIELARTDAIHLGITPPLRESGHLAGTPGLRLRGPRGEVALDHGAIIAQRHVHMNPADAERFGLRDRDVIQVRVRGDREMVLGDVVVRVAPDFTLDLHLDTDEANAAGLTSNQHVAFAGLERRG